MFSLHNGIQLTGFIEKWIFVLPLKDHSKWKAYFFNQGIDDSEYLSKIYNKNNNLELEAATSYLTRGYTWDVKTGKGYNVHTEESVIKFDDFAETVVNPKCDYLLSKMRYNQHPTRIDFWHQNYNTNGYHSPHYHPNALVSGIYLLELENENTTIFYSKKDDREYSLELNTAKEGDLILFDPTIWHSVDPCDGKKISVCFNLIKE